jgi:hypothetical protein
LAVTAPSFTPDSWPAFIAGNLLVGLTYACIGALAGSAPGQLGATYLVLFLAMLGIGILQNPMFGDGTPGGLAYAFPDYGAGRVIIDGAFSAGFPRLERAHAPARLPRGPRARSHMGAAPVARRRGVMVERGFAARRRHHTNAALGRGVRVPAGAAPASVDGQRQ